MNRSNFVRNAPQLERPLGGLRTLWNDNFQWILILLALIGTTVLAQAQISISHLSTYATGSYNTSSAEIADFDPVSDRIFFVNAQLNQVVALNASNPATPTLAFSIPMAAYGAGVNSVTVVPGGIAVAVEANPKTAPGVVAFFDANGVFLSQVTVGALPDMVTVTPDGSKVLVANEGEPNTAYTIDPIGSVSIIDITGGLALLTNANVTTLDFSAYTPAMLPGVRIFGPGASVAQDMEPEYIAVSDDSQKAFVVCQENNAMARINLSTNTIEQVTTLGLKDHSLPGNGLDASDNPTGINIANWPVKGLYMPDAIDAYTVGGQTYVVYANEGDAREYTPLNEARRIGNAAYVLDPAAFPNAATLKANANLGRLNASISSGNLDADPEFEEIHVFGSRSFSIRDANGTLVYDSGDDLELITAAAFPANFNCNNSANGTFDTRSDDKGPEPEAVVVADVFGATYAFIGLERIGGVMVYDVTVPNAPVFVQYLNHRNFAGNAAAGTALDLGVEGLSFVSAADSPNGMPFLISSNEISGTVSLFQVCEELPWYADMDGDGFGAAANDSLSCTQPVGYVLDSTDDCPTFFGRNGDICDANPGPGYTLGQITACACAPVACTQNLTIEFQTDANPGEVSWEIRQQGSNNLVQSGAPGSIIAVNGVQTVNTCVPAGCFYLKVLDGGNNGMGGYILRTAGSPGIRIIDNRNNFTILGTSQIAGGEGFCTPLGAASGISPSCDKFDWNTNGEFFVCSAVPAVSAVWNAGNTPAEATTGYEFQIFNPNGGYIYNRFRSHNVSDGFAPDNANRACHMKINNWALAQQIPANVLMNVRVRSRINGVNGNWGSACRFKIDPVQAACPLTKLMDIPGNQYLSCGATRSFTTGQYVHARPVSGATQYQFRFRIPAEGFVTVRTSSTYFVQLNWTSSPLQAGKTYDVEVRAFKNGVWCINNSNPSGGAPFVQWGDVCNLTIDNTPAIGGNENALGAGQSEPSLRGSAKQSEGLSMYPNPNRGDQLYLSLDAVKEGVHTVRVDIFDLFGKRVSARTIAVQASSSRSSGDGFINTVLELNGELANGMYMVHITAGEQRYTERLVIQK